MNTTTNQTPGKQGQEMKTALSLALVMLLVLSGCVANPTSNTSSNDSGTPASLHFTPPPSNVPIPHNDDIITIPGGPTYRANVHGPYSPTWPAIVTNSTSIRAFDGKLTLTYRSYIETLAGETRNDIFFLDASLATALPDPLQIGYNFTGLPAGITAVRDGDMYGGIGGMDHEASRVYIALTISPDVKAGVYNYTIHLDYQGKQFGSIPGVIKVLPAETEPWGAIYVPGKYLYVWGRLLLPEPDGTILGSYLYPGSNGLLSWWQNQTAVVNNGVWSANVSLGVNSTPSILDSGEYTVIIMRPDYVTIIGYVDFYARPTAASGP